ncbi:MAG TPA: hypothetical protein PLU10_03395 [Chitinophagaceae bacterium]|nr:hypothetical protein [Chitinophagaceae bacterium]
MLQRIIILLCVIFLSSIFKGYTQNAYYDAIRIASCISKDSFGNALPILLNYTNKGDAFPWERLSKKYPAHVKLLKDKSDFIKLKQLDNLLNTPESIAQVLARIPNSGSDYLALRDAFTNYNKANQRFVKLESIMLNLDQAAKEPGNSRLQSTIRLQLNDVGLADAPSVESIEATPIEDTVSEDLDRVSTAPKLWTLAVQRTQKATEEELAEMDNSRNIIKKLISNPSVYQVVFNDAAYTATMNASRDFQLKVENERIASFDKFQEASQSATTSFRIPSQAEMIDALAIYLAKRMKQEVAISFIEKLNNYIRDQDVLAILFPATLKLLNNREAFVRPNFGTAWQIALSDDFIHIPEHITACLPSRYHYMQSYLNDGVRIGKLVQQHYSFTEAVNQLYQEPLEVAAMRNANSMIYILNHEFYVVGDHDKSNYWISAEQLQRMSQEELEWMYILLDVRYGESLAKMMSNNWLGKTVWNESYFVTKVYPFRNWLTRIMVQLNHFESELHKSASQKEAVKTGEALMGYWKFQNDLMEAVIDTQFMHVPVKMMKSLDITRSVFSVYSGIESKNYPLVVEQVLKLFSLLELDKDIDVEELLFKPSLQVMMTGKDKLSQQVFAKQLQQLNDNYNKISATTSIVSFMDAYAKFQQRLKETGRIDELKWNQSGDELKGQLIKLLSKENDMPLQQVLCSEAFLKSIEKNQRDKDLIALLNVMKDKYAQMMVLQANCRQSMLVIDSIQHQLKELGLKKGKYLRMKSQKLGDFSEDKLFTLYAPDYNSYLCRIESRTRYQKITTAMSFLSDVMQAGNSQVLSKVVESYALPPSSYKLKRYSRFSIMIDALVGAYGGIEYVKDDKGKSAFTPVGGLSAPIGISFSWGKRTKLKSNATNQLLHGEKAFLNRRGDFKKLKAYNLTVMASLVDIGAAVSYRITNQSDGGLPADAKWSQLFSPGLLALVGIKGMPLCIGAGARFTPNLRTFNQSLQRNALRFDVGVYFDLPLVNVFYKQ